MKSGLPGKKKKRFVPFVCSEEFKAAARPICRPEAPAFILCRRRDFSTTAELYEFHLRNGTLGVFWAMFGVFFDGPCS
jgi:hypothetical protein